MPTGRLTVNRQLERHIQPRASSPRGSRDMPSKGHRGPGAAAGRAGTEAARQLAGGKDVTGH